MTRCQNICLAPKKKSVTPPEKVSGTTYLLHIPYLGCAQWGLLTMKSYLFQYRSLWSASSWENIGQLYFQEIRCCQANIVLIRKPKVWQNLRSCSAGWWEASCRLALFVKIPVCPRQNSRNCHRGLVLFRDDLHLRSRELAWREGRHFWWRAWSWDFCGGWPV